MARTNNLGRDPVFPLVLRLTLPTMLAQLVSVLYSIVDRMYIGAGVGDLALAGVGICGPIVTFLSSFATLVGLGGSPIMAMRMGEGNKEEAQRILSSSFSMLLGLSVVLTTVFLLTKRQLLWIFGASDATFTYANQYLSIYVAGTFFVFLSTGLNSFLICQGFSGLGMITVTLGAVMNIALDPLFIFVFHMDVAGAALATVISQMASCVFVLLALLQKNIPVRLCWGGFVPRITKQIVAFGLSPFLIIASDSIILLILNAMLQKTGGPELGDKLVTCATIVQSYFLMISMPMGGITGGGQPVVSFNFGSGQVPRIKKAITYILLLCLGFCLIMTIASYTLSPLFVSLFTTNSVIAADSVRYIKIFTLMILPLAVQYTLVDETIALGRVKLALFCSMFRKCMFLLMVILLPTLFGAEAAFYSEPIVDFIAAAMTIFLFQRFVPKILNKRSSGECAIYH